MFLGKCGLKPLERDTRYRYYCAKKKQTNHKCDNKNKARFVLLNPNEPFVMEAKDFVKN